MNSSDKTASHRPIEIQKAIIPETMQAVTQDTIDYLQNAIKKEKTFQYLNGSAYSSSTLQQQVVPRSSSRDEYNQKADYENIPQIPIPQSKSHKYTSNSILTPTTRQYQYTNGSIDSLGQSHTVHAQSRIQKAPDEFDVPSSLITRPNKERNLPLSSSKPITGDSVIKKVLYVSSKCEVFHWNNQSWYAADGQCLLEVRLTQSNRTCVTVELQNKGQLYLNAWILSSTVVRQPSPTDVSLSVFMEDKKENYLIHMEHPEDAALLFNILQNNRQLADTCIHTDLEDDFEPHNTINCPQTLKTIVECRAKLYVQTETSKWTTFGSVNIVVYQQEPSMRSVIQIENNKTKLVSAVVKSGNVEKISNKRISFLLTDERQKTSIVYMIHLREEEAGNKIYEQIRLKNAEHGW